MIFLSKEKKKIFFGKYLFEKVKLGAIFILSRAIYLKLYKIRLKYSEILEYFGF